MTSNMPDFDPLNATEEEAADMIRGYIGAAISASLPPDATVAFEHGWRMRRNDMNRVVDADQREIARRMLQQSLGR